MKVADLFAVLGLRVDKGDFKKRRDELGHFVKGANKSVRGVGHVVGGVTKKVAAMAAGFFAVSEGIDQLRGALDFDAALTDLAIAGGDAVDDVDAMREKILAVSDATGVAKETVLAGTQSFIALTGDAATATQSMELFARVTKATGAEMSDITTVAARLIQNMGIAPDKFEKAFSVLIRSGKAGAIELKEMASLFGELTPLSEKFEGGAGLEGLNSLSAALQLVMQGAGSAPEAATQLRSLYGAVSGGAAKRLAKEGIQVFNKDGSIRQFQTIVEEIQKKGFRRDKLIEIFGRKEAVAAFESLTKVEGAWDGLRDSSRAATDVADDYARRQKAASEKVRRAWNKAKNAISRAFTVVVEVLAKLTEHADLVVVALTSIGTAMLIVKARSIGAAIASAAAWVLATLPLILLAAIIAGVILIVEDLYRWFTGGESVFKKFYEAASSWLGEKWNRLLDGMVAAAADALAALDPTGVAKKKLEASRRRRREAAEFAKARGAGARANAAEVASARAEISRIIATPRAFRSDADKQQLMMMSRFVGEAEGRGRVTNNVTVNAPGGDPQQVKQATMEAMEEANRSRRRAAAAQAGAQ